MKTQYWILKYLNDNACPETVINIETFDKELLERAFSKACYELKEGEELEYGKTTEKEYHPDMLNVERTKNGFVKHHNGRKFKYTPKYPVLVNPVANDPQIRIN